MKHRSDYSITHVEPPTDDQPGFLGLIDEDLGSISVTNDAEHVVADLGQQYDLTRYVVLYRDSLGYWDQLLTDGNMFVGFAPCNRSQSFEEAKEYKLRTKQLIESCAKCGLRGNRNTRYNVRS